MDPDQPSPQPVQQAPAGAPPATLGVKIFFALVLLIFLGGGYGGIKTYLDTRSEKAALDSEGVEVDATVSSYTEHKSRRGARYYELFVSYDKEDSIAPEFVTVMDCESARYEPGVETVRIVYLPDDPDVAVLERCRSDFSVNIFPGIIGVVFGAIGLFFAWKTRGVWRE